MDEAWQPSSSYSPDAFYCDASDSHGHSEYIKVRLRPQVKAQIHALVGKGVFPYRSSADFFRDAVNHRLAYLNEKLKDGGIHQVLVTDAMLARLEYHRRNMEAAVTVVEQAKLTLTQLEHQEDWPGIIAALKDLKDGQDELQEPFASRLKDTLRAFENKVPKGYLALADEILGVAE